MLAAVQRSDRKPIDVLMQAGADINARSHWWAGVLGVPDEGSPTLASFLTDRGAIVAVRLRHACASSKTCANCSPPIPMKSTSAVQTDLPLCIYATAVEIAQYLLDRGADIDALDLLNESTPARHMLRVVGRLGVGAPAP